MDMLTCIVSHEVFLSPLPNTILTFSKRNSWMSHQDSFSHVGIVETVLIQTVIWLTKFRTSLEAVNSSVEAVLVYNFAFLAFST